MRPSFLWWKDGRRAGWNDGWRGEAVGNEGVREEGVSGEQLMKDDSGAIRTL